MTLEKFKELVDGAPLARNEIAYAMAAVDDDSVVAQAGQAYLDAEQKIDDLFDELGIEFG